MEQTTQITMTGIVITLLCETSLNVTPFGWVTSVDNVCR